MTRRIARHAIATSALAVLVLGASACGSQDSTSAEAPEATVTVTETPTTDDTDSQTDDRDDRNQGGQNQGGQNRGGQSNDAGALPQAVRTASGAVSGTVVGIDQQLDGWEVDVVAGDGSETRVLVSADGSRVLDRRPDAQDADDLAENQQLLGARVAWAAALDTAQGELGNGIDELDLGEDDGRITWEASVPGDGPGSTVVIDAGSGQVIGTDD